MLLRKSMLALLSLLFGSLLVVSAQSATPQAATCPDIVKAAVQVTGGACSGIGRNQACYGNLTLQALFRDGAVPVKFDQTGDLVSIANLRALHLSSMSLTDNSWGIALMRIQANLPDTLPGQNVSFVLFGNVQINNTALPLQTVSLTTTGSANVRSRPSTQGTVIGSLQRGMTVIGNGRLEDSSWIHVQLPDGTSSGWVSDSLLHDGGDLHLLTVIDSTTPLYGPMQAFSFTSGIGDTPCPQVPASGILIQAPSAGKVNLMINGASMTFGSTAYLQAQAGGFMTISVVEGSVTVTVNGVTVSIPAGRSARVPLDVNGVVSGAPESPQPYDATALAALPVTLLPDPVSVGVLSATPEATAAPEATSEATAEATANASADASAIVTSADLPQSGTWSVISTLLPAATSGCSRTHDQTTLMFLITVENGGAVLNINGDEFADRTAPGVYVVRGLPIDTTKTQQFGVIRQSDTIDVLSATHMHEEAISYFPTDKCYIRSSLEMTYVGPVADTGG